MLVQRWFALTRGMLPALAARHRWPIRFDHCFMRVCLDHAFGRPWRTVVGAPAIRNMTGAELLAAVAVAERIAANPEILPALNRESLRLRRQ
ncbi:MAG: hypothetical protein JOZ42_11225 [Acetobacteraceae bacterium]|nr:hypothetical protein [Acetobacteraceae bacterium]